MAAYEALLLCSLLWVFSAAEGKAVTQMSTITCVNSEDCVLPCRFQYDGKGARIMWYRGEAVVSCTRYGDTSFVRGHNSPAPEYEGRTRLYADQVLKGNATLVLRNVTLKDQGTYRCVTFLASQKEESEVVVNVKAPDHTVAIQQEGNRITCSSEGIYPEPELTWSTSPPSNVTFEISTTVQQTEQQLYNINSSLIVSENAPDLVHSCTVRSGTNRRTATLFKPISINDSDTETTIPCGSTNSSINGFILIWRFNQDQIILNQTNVPCTVSDEWKQHVKRVSESGSLTLQDLSSNQEGTYTCELTKDEETCVTNAVVRIKKSPDSNCVIVPRHLSPGDVLILIAVLVVAVCVTVLLACYCTVPGRQHTTLLHPPLLQPSDPGSPSSPRSFPTPFITSKQQEFGASRLT